MEWTSPEFRVHGNTCGLPCALGGTVYNYNTQGIILRVIQWLFWCVGTYYYVTTQKFGQTQDNFGCGTHSIFERYCTNFGI